MYCFVSGRNAICYVQVTDRGLSAGLLAVSGVPALPFQGQSNVQNKPVRSPALTEELFAAPLCFWSFFEQT